MKKLSSDIVETGVESQNGLMENSMIAFFLGKPNGSILQVNQAACDMFDYTAEEFKQLNQHDYIEFDDAELEKVISARREKGSIKAAFTAIRKNGERFPIEVFSVLFKNADGEERTSALVSDISERKKTKEAFVKARQQFEGLVNTVNGIVWEADAKTFAFSFVSKQAEVLLGYPIQQWLDVPTFWEDHIHPDDRHWAVAFCEQHVREKKSHKFEYRMLAADGRVVWLQDIVSVILENDEPAYITGLMIDITERKNTEQHLIDSERRYRSLFEQNVAGVYRTTISGRILACNLAFATMLGYGSSNELLDKEALDLYYSETERNQFIELLRKQKKIYNSEFVLKRKDNNPLFILENISLSADPNSGEEFIDGVMIDITERRNTAAALQKSYEDVIANESLLKSAEKLAHVGSWSADLVNGISKWSDEAFRIYGYEPGSIDPTFDFFLSRIHPDDLLMVKEKLEHAFEFNGFAKAVFQDN